MKRIAAVLAALVALLALCPVAMAEDVISIEDVYDYADDWSDNDVYYLEDDEYVVVDLTRDPEHSVYLVFRLEGTNDHILAARLLTDVDYHYSSEEERSQAIALANQWNYEHRYPKAYIDPNDGQYMADGHLFCIDPTEGMVREFVEDQIYGTEQMLQFFADSGVSAFAPYAED
ncbi:MAG TPA: YbjN domain-containing protein [Candidatus Pullichristensenella avicola]|nr:YbjN domain-containing protein [Candidatus Pullichristensenella avicola]